MNSDFQLIDIEKKLDKIMERLGKIEKLLNEKCSQETCNHEWQSATGASTMLESTSPLQQCKKCGSYRSEDPFTTITD